MVEGLESIVLRPDDADKKKMLKEGSPVEVFYGKKLFRAHVTAVRGHEKYDILYDDDKTKEPGVDISRLIPVHSAFRTHKFGNVTLPLVCIPLRHRDKGIGVLNVDNFDMVPKASYDTQPELGLHTFLEKLGRILGTTIDTQRKKASLKSLLMVARNMNSELEDILEELHTSIASNLFYLTSFVATRIVVRATRKLSH